MLETINNSSRTDSNHSRVILKFSTKSSVLFTNLTVKVYLNRVSIEYKPIWGGGESRKTYSAIDIGDIYIKKGFRRATIGVCRINSSDVLFQIGNLKKNDAEKLKDALDRMISYRYHYIATTAGNNTRRIY